jgi:predicted phage tail component-like protein
MPGILYREGDDSLHYCIFNDMNSQDYGLNLEKVPSRTSPKQRITEVVIPGRNGTLTQTDGTYDVFTREADFVLMDLSKIPDICTMYRGAGWMTFDDEPDKRYYARVVSEISPEWFTAGWRKLAVQFECQPFARERFPQTAVFTAAGSLYNIGTADALPTIKITGTGTVTITVNGKNFTVQGVSGTATVDCENMQAYSGSTLLVTSGEFPTLTAGKNTIGFAGASKLEIIPNWRWL